MISAITVPFMAERFLGITIPENGFMYACSYEGLHKIAMSLKSVAVETDEAGIEDYELLRSKGTALGVMGGAPLYKSEKTSLSYTFQPRATEQLVSIIHADKSVQIAFPTLSGDWFFATLSRCGHFLVLAEPYGLEIYALV